MKVHWACFMLLCTSSGTATGVEESIVVVEQLQQALIEAMQAGDSLGFEERYAALAPVVDQTHDMPYIARLVLGRQWRQLDPSQQERFVTAFRNLSVATYASRFVAYADEQFVVGEQIPQPRGGILVLGEMHRPGGQPLPFEYHLRQNAEGGWRIVNIIVDGVSDLALKRAEYSGILADAGFSGLLQSLEQQAEAAAQRSK